MKCDCLANRLLSLLPILTKVWKTPKCVNSLQREKCRQEKKAAWTLCQSKKSNGHSVSGELQSCTHTHVTHTRRQMLKFSKSYRLYKLNIRWVHSQRGANPPHPTRKDCVSLPVHPATVLFTKKKEPGSTVNPIKVNIITAYGLLHNTTNTITLRAAFLLCLSEKSCSTLPKSAAWPRKATSKERRGTTIHKKKKNLCCDLLCQSDSCSFQHFLPLFTGGCC